MNTISPHLNNKQWYNRDALIAACDLADLMASETGTTAAPGGRWACHLPQHGYQSGKTPPVSIKGDRWTCWVCAKSGTAICLLMATRGITDGEAIRLLAQIVGASPSSSRTLPPRTVASRKSAQPQQTARTPVADKTLPVSAAVAEETLSKYLIRRGYHPDIPAETGLTVRSSKWGLMIRHSFSVVDQRFGWQDRMLYKSAPAKWMALKGWARKPHGIDQLAHLDRADLSKRTVLLTEGPADALTVRSVWPEAVVLGIPGVDWSDLWTQALAAAGVTRTLLAYDPDDPGRGGAQNARKGLKPAGIAANDVPIPAEGDINEWSRAAGAAFPDDFAAAIVSAGGNPDVLLGPRR